MSTNHPTRIRTNVLVRPPPKKIEQMYVQNFQIGVLQFRARGFIIVDTDREGGEDGFSFCDVLSCFWYSCVNRMAFGRLFGVEGEQND